MNTSIKLVAGLVILASISSCGGKKPEQTASAPALAPTVKVISAQKQLLSLDQNYSVTLQAFAVNNIAPQTAARISKINVEVGDFVKEGQVLAEMDPIQLEQAELQYINAGDELKRMRSLYEKGGISKSDFEAVELSYKVKKSSYENLLTNTILKSPLKGVVTARSYDRGDMYAMASPLFVVQQIDPMKALVAVSEKDYSFLKKGVKVEFAPEALPGKTFSGQVSRVYPTVDPATHTVLAEVLIPNAKYELRPGMYAGAKIIFGHDSRIVVPDTAVQKQQGSGRRTVFILEPDSTVSIRVVEIGRHMGSSYEILSGINEGEQVVVNGQSALRAGTKVEVIR